MEGLLRNIAVDLATCESIERNLRGKAAAAKINLRSGDTPTRDVKQVVQECVQACRESRKRYHEENGPGPDTSDEALSQYARFTDHNALRVYRQFLWYAPRLVNVVTLAEAIPMPGSGVSLPLNLGLIASRCKGSYYAPKRFAAVQLAYSNPRCRVLVFHTGRLVGTGTGGAAAARVAIGRAQRQLALEGGVHLHVRNFAVINQVGAASLRATLNCDAFAREHSAESHFDKASFVGLAWRPPREDICCEIYSTGRANLPGSVNERQLLASFSRMLPELLRFSSASHILDKIPQELQDHHRVKEQVAPQMVDLKPATLGRSRKVLVKAPEKQVAKKVSIWDGWDDADNGMAGAPESDEELDLNEFGL